MENRLKEKDSGLYFLCKYAGNEKTYNLIKKLITVYKTDDEILTEFIKELHNQKVLSESKLRDLISLANDRLTDGTNLINSFISSKNASDLLFLLNLIEIRLTKNNYQEDMVSLINQILLDKDFKIIIADNNSNLFKPETLIKISLTSQNPELIPFIEEILYSKKVNELKVQTLRSAISFLSRNKNCSYEEILEELILNHLSDLQLLIDLKEEMLNSKNKELQIKGGVTDIYDTFYTKYSGVNNPASRKIIEDPKNKFEGYSEEVLKKFVDSLNGSYINKTSYLSSDFDVVGAMLYSNKPQRAEDIFIKSSYKPINKVKRKEELSFYRDYIYEFAPRLNSNIGLCIKNGYYDLLLTIVSAKKIDSLHVNTLYRIISEINQVIKLDSEKAKVCQLILDTLLLRISEEKLTVYRTSKLGYEIDSISTHILNKDGALNFINKVIANPRLKIEDPLEKNKSGLDF